jgi:hypothetical protein
MFLSELIFLLVCLTKLMFIHYKEIRDILRFESAAGCVVRGTLTLRLNSVYECNT